jgi:hypothetical protein
VQDAGFEVRSLEAAPADPTTGVCWIGLHACTARTAS